MVCKSEIRNPKFFLPIRIGIRCAFVHADSMKIVLEYVAMLKLDGPATGSTMPIQEGTTIAALLEQLGIPERHRSVISPFVNNRQVSRSYILRDGDCVFLSMPIGGG